MKVDCFTFSSRGRGGLQESDHRAAGPQVCHPQNRILGHCWVLATRIPLSSRFWGVKGEEKGERERDKNERGGEGKGEKRERRQEKKREQKKRRSNKKT